MNIICAILTGLQYVVQSLVAFVKRTKISKKSRREKAVFVIGCVAVAAIAFSSHNVHAQGKNQEEVLEGNEIQLDEEEPVEEQNVYGLDSIIQSILLNYETERQINRIGTSFEIVLVGQRVMTREILPYMDFAIPTRDILERIQEQSMKFSESQLVMSDTDYENLLKIVEAEAGGEDIKGRILVANVIFNRVKSPNFPSTVTDVIWQRTGGNAQFSPISDGRIYTVKVSEGTKEAVNRAIDGEDYSQGALFFIEEPYAEKNNIKWFKEELKFLYKHGVHDFYTYP